MYVAIITGVFTLAGVIITVLAGQRRTAKDLKEQSNITLYRLDQLEKKQDKHNSLIERMYAVEDRLNVIDEKISVTNHRLTDLEKGENS